MDVIFGLVPAMILLALGSAAVFFWSARNGQYEDMEGPAHRILNDDDDPKLPWVDAETKQSGDETAQQPKRP